MTEPPAFTTALGTLAWRICSDEKRSPVAIESHEDRLTLQPAFVNQRLLEDERGVRFANEEDLAIAAAVHVVAKEGDHLTRTPRECFERLAEIWAQEIGKQHRVSGHVLAGLHNAGRLDGFAWGREAIEAGVGVFDVLNVMESGIPLFRTANAQEIKRFFAGHHEQVKGDLAGGIVYVKMPPWFASQPQLADTLKKLHEDSPQEDSATLYGCALHGLILHRFDEGFHLALEAAKSQAPLVSGPALQLLGLVDFSQHPAALVRVIEWCAGIVRTPGHAQLETAIRTLGRLLPTAENQIVPLLDEAARTDAPGALYALSEALWRAQEASRERPWFWPLYVQLTRAKAEHKGILDHVDMVLMAWIRHPSLQNRVLEFLSGWIGNQSIEAIRDIPIEKLFDATLHKLTREAALFNRAVTQWLLHDDMRYPMVASHIISRLREPRAVSLSLDRAMVNTLRPNELRFLVRRILGYIIGADVQIALVFSLLGVCDGKAPVLGLVMTALRDHVGHDYPYQTIEFLRNRVATESDEEIKALCAEVIAALERNIAALDALPRLKELVPTSVKVHRFARARGKQMSKAFDEASKDSIWRQLTSHVVLKAGLRTFQNFQGRFTEPMELKSMSHEMALPRSEISDPAGAARRRLMFKASTRDAS